MGIRDFFHKIKMGFVRGTETSIPYVSFEKRYGNYGEDEFVYFLKQALPTCRIKKNVVINTTEGNAEIDCLMLYNNKLFAIEVKRWKGRIVETEEGFVQEKTDRWTGEIHIKYQKSPFKQLNRAIYLLRKQIPDKAWINAIVFFEDDEFESIETMSDGVWFNDINRLVEYIRTEGQLSYANSNLRFFEKCISADYLYAKSWDKSLHCIIAENTLCFNVQNKMITKNQIRYINVKHHWSYDELLITLNNGENFSITQENAKIKIFDNGVIREYALCKLDYIEVGI